MKTNILFVSAALVAGLAIAVPLAGALSWGVDAGGVPTMQAAGASPQLGQLWVGKWTASSGWDGVDRSLAAMRDANVTPVIMWYYWGDAISPTCVQLGCNGLSFAEWNAMAQQLATHASGVMGGKPFFVVLEPEFNKGGMSSWEPFDGYLADQANAIRATAPSVRIVTGFGSWGGWDIFDRAVAASDLVGYQLLVGSTRDAASDATNAAATLVSTATTLHAKWGKPLLVFDLDVGTYGGWEQAQAQALQGIAAARSDLEAAGVQAIVWRYVGDNGYSSGYFGSGESTWGVAYADGSHKPGFDALVAAIQSGDASATTTFTATFTHVTGNPWWVQADVGGGDITSVYASLNGGAWVPLAKQWWGSWAGNFYVAPGTEVQFLAANSTGAQSLSGTYPW